MAIKATINSDDFKCIMEYLLYKFDAIREEGE